MNDEKQENQQPPSQSENEAKAQAQNPGPKADSEEPLELNVEYKTEKSPDEITVESLLQQIESLATQNKELNDKFLRTMADMENLRRRKDREIADKEKYAFADFARDILSVADNIQRAIESVPKDAVENDDPLRLLLEGMQMTERDFNNALERRGITRIDPLDSAFDPNLHQAMFEVEDPERPNGTVIQVIQAGYIIGERTLRPALVGVSKGGTARASQPENSSEEEVKTEETEAANSEAAASEKDQTENKAETSAKNGADKSKSASQKENADKGIGQTVDKSA